MLTLEKIKNCYKGTEAEVFSFFEIKTSHYEWLIKVAEKAEAFVFHDGPPIPTMPEEAGNAFVDLRNALNSED